MLEVTMLPARQGDAIWIRWGDGETHQILIDMGTEEVGNRIRERILALPEDRRRFELIVVSHIDRDHIGGVLTCLAEADPIPGFLARDFWFNGFDHLSGGKPVSNALETLGVPQGEKLGKWLKHQAWNSAFGGGPVQRVPDKTPPTIGMPGGLNLSVLGPTPERLAALRSIWAEELGTALASGLQQIHPSGLESLGPKVAPILVDKGDLLQLAETSTGPDSSKANGSSIALLLEYGSRKIILSGDAFAEDMISGIDAVSGGTRLHVDAFKLPHHGSKQNVTRSLVEHVTCDRWLISTDGTQFRHPDPVAIARIICCSKKRSPRLYFNVRSKVSGWWDCDAWRRLYDYETEYGSEENGLTLSLARV